MHREKIVVRSDKSILAISVGLTGEERLRVEEAREPNHGGQNQVLSPAVQLPAAGRQIGKPVTGTVRVREPSNTWPIPKAIY